MSRRTSVVVINKICILCMQGDNFKKTGCFDAICPGFVQVHPRITLGQTIEPSFTGGLDGKDYIAIKVTQVNFNTLLENSYISIP